MLSSSSFLRSRMPLAVFTNTETGRTILPLSHSGPPSHLRRTIVTTVLISQNDSHPSASAALQHHLRVTGVCDFGYRTSKSSVPQDRSGALSSRPLHPFSDPRPLTFSYVEKAKALLGRPHL